MSYWDRHRWPRAAGAMQSSALVALFAAWFRAQLLPLDLRRSTLFITSDILLAGDIAGVLLGMALYIVIKMALAGRRLARIGDAINGNQDTLPRDCSAEVRVEGTA